MVFLVFFAVSVAEGLMVGYIVRVYKSKGRDPDGSITMWPRLILWTGGRSGNPVVLG